MPYPIRYSKRRFRIVGRRPRSYKKRSRARFDRVRPLRYVNANGVVDSNGVNAVILKKCFHRSRELTVPNWLRWRIARSVHVLNQPNDVSLHGRLQWCRAIFQKETFILAIHVIRENHPHDHAADGISSLG